MFLSIGFLAVRSADDDRKGAPREKRSVVQECCHRTCPISELESYCNHDDDMVSHGQPSMHNCLQITINQGVDGNSQELCANTTASVDRIYLSVNEYRRRYNSLDLHFAT